MARQFFTIYVTVLIVLTCQVACVHGFALRSRLDQGSSHGLSHLEKSTQSSMKSMPPFDINPATFLSLIGAVPTDSLLLFFSPTCPDCEKLAPLWTKVTAAFQSNQDLTILSVSDDAGKAPGPYHHDENPAIFFIPKGDVNHPIAFPMSDLHQFIALPETSETDDDIVNKILGFARGHATGTGGAAAPQTEASTVQPVVSMPVLTESESSALTARLLATLKAKEATSLEDQMEIVYEPQYEGLLVTKFLKHPIGKLGDPLAIVAAKYLDGVPLATQWANQYAKQQDAKYRSEGWQPAQEEEQKYYQDLLDYAIPMYAQSIYFQRSAKN